VLDDLVANAWPIIRKYPTERRPRRIVANLVRDTAFETFVRPVRRRSSGEIATSHDRMIEPAAQPSTEALDELVALLLEARRRGIAQADIDLICQLVSLGRPEEVATARNVTPRTVRNHRDAVIHRLRNIIAEAA
jgi:DNA-binding CsgD family transcriptional regulator